jgi:hypothetical protein
MSEEQVKKLNKSLKDELYWVTDCWIDAAQDGDNDAAQHFEQVHRYLRVLLLFETTLRRIPYMGAGSDPVGRIIDGVMRDINGRMHAG